MLVWCVCTHIHGSLSVGCVVLEGRVTCTQQKDAYVLKSAWDTLQKQTWGEGVGSQDIWNCESLSSPLGACLLGSLSLSAAALHTHVEGKCLSSGPFVFPDVCLGESFAGKKAFVPIVAQASGLLLWTRVGKAFWLVLADRLWSNIASDPAFTWVLCTEGTSVLGHRAAVEVGACWDWERRALGRCGCLLRPWKRSELIVVWTPATKLQAKQKIDDTGRTWK